MTSVVWDFHAMDTWFFRNGTPFNLGNNVGDGDMMFPPSMSTVQGAIRTAIARGQGWSPQHPERWPSLLGSADSLGALSLKGPYLLRGDDYLFPLPRHLLRVSDTWVRLRPGPFVETDIGVRRLPVVENRVNGVQTVDNAWITSAGLSRVLRGDVPRSDDVVLAADLWKAEPHTGLTINPSTGAATPSLLYHTVHTRVVSTTHLAVTVEGIPSEWQAHSLLIPFGGEGRYAYVTTRSSTVPIPTLPEVKPDHSSNEYRVWVLLLTAGSFDDVSKVMQEGPLPWPCLSAVTGRVHMQGGWDLQRQRPRPLKPFIPSGSVWFYQLTPSQWEQVQGWHGQQVGLDQEYGYGQFVFGLWEE
ncbi:MAG: hypothetical protein C7B44_10435 [Sulfobacillus thermosulfidooxidans]|nr:MAG: hypothetical protein C7B44_10435 [Sulfobacillus thermosulfidooxidans]